MADGSEHTLMFTVEQARKMLPAGAADNARAIGARCRKAGAEYVTGWPVDEIEQIVRGDQTVTRVVPGDEPLEVVTFAQVAEMVRDLGWLMTESSIRWHLSGRGTKAVRGYGPPDEVRKAMTRPAGSNWRQKVPGALNGRKFT